MRFGLFDHMDRSGEELAVQYENRLQFSKPATGPDSTAIISPSITARRSGSRRRPPCFWLPPRSGPADFGLARWCSR
jgi:hypothetical protein